MPPLGFGGGSRTLNLQAPMMSVPRYHVATINQCFNRKNTFFLISKHCSIIFSEREKTSAIGNEIALSWKTICGDVSSHAGHPPYNNHCNTQDSAANASCHLSP